MKANISIPKDDSCTFCDQECPEDVYDCIILRQAMNSKQAVYKWCWVEKTPKKPKEN